MALPAVHIRDVRLYLDEARANWQAHIHHGDKENKKATIKSLKLARVVLDIVLNDLGNGP